MKALLRKVIPSRSWNALSREYHKLRSLYTRRVINDYSQSGETVRIRELLCEKARDDNSFFVEIGANDGVTVSTTFGLVKDGWRGLSVEANPTVYARLKSNLRSFPNINAMCVAVAPHRGPIRLYLGKDDPQGLFSTISTEKSNWFEKHRSEEFVEVPGVPITDLLIEQKVPADFDLLLIDAEGMDYDILATLDFRTFRPKLIATEDYEPKNSDKFRLLERAGYLFAERVGCNTLWLSR